MTAGAARLYSHCSMRALIVLSTFAVAQTAAAFECNNDAAGGASTVWLQRCLLFYVEQNSTTLFEKESAVRAALGTYTGVECTDLELRHAGSTDEQPGFFDAYAPKSVIGIGRPEQFPDTNLVSMNITSYDSATGAIRDADIVLNGSKVFGEVRDASTCQDVYDLQSVLTRELFAALGFQERRSTESCTTADRALSEDALDGLCTVYPAGLPVKPCVPAESYETAQGLASASCPDLSIAETEASCGCRAAARETSTDRSALHGILVLLALAGARRTRMKKS